MNDIIACKGYIVKLPEERRVLVYESRGAATEFINWYLSSDRKGEMPKPSYVIDIPMPKSIVCPHCGSIEVRPHAGLANLEEGCPKWACKQCHQDFFLPHSHG